jgi:hypothetical protein
MKTKKLETEINFTPPFKKNLRAYQEVGPKVRLAKRNRTYMLTI